MNMNRSCSYTGASASQGGRQPRIPRSSLSTDNEYQACFRLPLFALEYA